MLNDGDLPLPALEKESSEDWCGVEDKRTRAIADMMRRGRCPTLVDLSYTIMLAVVCSSYRL